VIPDTAATPASQARADRLWIWAALGLQLTGYAIDFAWHGLVNPDAEPATRRDMIRHLTTVHAPLYIGTACVFLAIVRAMAHRTSRFFPGAPHALAGGPLVVALAGAVLSVGAEAWHAYEHLQLDTRHAPLAGSLSVVGYLVAAIATIVGGRRARRHGSDSVSRRHAA
jgi:hypothetical protein